MKKKIISITCIVSLICAMIFPAVALAGPSQELKPVHKETTDPNGVTIKIDGAIPGGVPEGYNMTITSTENVASNVPSNATVISSFYLYTSPESWMDEIWQYTYTINLSAAGAEVYDGQKVTLYVQLKNGQTKILTATIQNGNVSFSSQLAEYFTLVAGWPGEGGGGGTTTGGGTSSSNKASYDDSSISPKTSDGSSLFILLAGIALVSAGSAASIAFKRKNHK